MLCKIYSFLQTRTSEKYWNGNSLAALIFPAEKEDGTHWNRGVGERSTFSHGLFLRFCFSACCSPFG